MPRTDLDLDPLRSEMMDYMRETRLPIFYGVGSPEDEDYVVWDSAAFPDWRQFVDVARESGARMLLFSSLAMSEGDLDVALEKLGDCDMNGEERGFYARTFEGLRKHSGRTAWLRIAFEHSGRWLSYEITAAWYEDFRSAIEDLDVFLPLAEEEEEEGGAGRGFFSRN